jgi:hypothetical protein
MPEVDRRAVPSVFTNVRRPAIRLACHGLKLGSEIAAGQGRVLASAELGNGPGVDNACPAPYLQNAGIGATLSITTSKWHTQAQARA